MKLDQGLRYQHIEDGNGAVHLADTWITAGDMQAARFDPDRQIVYHLFTRNNQLVSQPLLQGSTGLLGMTNWDSRRRTIVLIHGWRVDINAAMNTLLIPGFLDAEDVNIIALDWSAGAGTINYAQAVMNTIIAGEAVANFINWLKDTTGANLSMYHIVGHSLGAHMAGIIGRNVDGNIAYITGLEAALPGWISSNDVLKPSDADYVEVIHTNAGVLGFASTLGHCDFYPNGGLSMPGCDSQECDHARSYHYFAESLYTTFTGRRCSSFTTAMINSCILPGTLRMGGLTAKPGRTGVYRLETNAAPPFSRG